MSVKTQGNDTAIKSITFGTSFDEVGPVKSSDIGGIIGKSAIGAKMCISNAWKMYEKVASEDMSRVSEEEKPSLKIVFHPLRGETENTEYPEQVWVQVFSESETMLKLAQLSVKKHVNEFLSRKTLSSREFYIEFPHNLLGKLIGKKACGLNRILEDTLYKRHPGPRDVLIDESDIPTAKTARIRIKELEYEPSILGNNALINHVNARGNRTFLGWPPSKEDKYEEHISITVSFKRDCTPFNDVNLYIERLTSVLSDRIQEIVDQDEDEMDEINEFLENY